MPELPEIITIREDLKKEILGKRVIKVRKAKDYPLKHSMSMFKENIVGHEAVKVSNIAKLLTIEFSSGNFIVSHLNMSGNLLYNLTDPYVKISIEFNTGDVLHYSTVRMFGYFEVWSKENINEYKSRYGKTIIESGLTRDDFLEKLSNKNVPIKNVLLNQKIISGIGNIYANDALYMSKIHPKRKAKSLGEKELLLLFNNLQEILMEGVKNRGSSIDRYKDLYGKPGKQQEHFRIYGKKGKKCKVCGDGIKFEKIQGRGTFYCPTCQPENNQLKML